MGSQVVETGAVEGRLSTHLRFASPLGDARDLSVYHEVFIGATKNDEMLSEANLFISEFGGNGRRFVSHEIRETGLNNRKALGRNTTNDGAGVNKRNLKFVGEFDRTASVETKCMNPSRSGRFGG